MNQMIHTIPEPRKAKLVIDILDDADCGHLLPVIELLDR